MSGFQAMVWTQERVPMPLSVQTCSNYFLLPSLLSQESRLISCQQSKVGAMLVVVRRIFISGISQVTGFPTTNDAPLSVLLKRMLIAALLEFQTLRDLEHHTEQQLAQLHEARKRYDLLHHRATLQLAVAIVLGGPSQPISDVSIQCIISAGPRRKL